MDRLEQIRTFLEVARSASFTKAGEKLSRSTQLCSKYVSQLEQDLGVRLFNRTTRKLHLTDEGEQYRQAIAPLLERFEEVENALSHQAHEPQGPLRIATPITFSSLVLAPLIGRFIKKYPLIDLDVAANDRKIDLIEEGFDLALRIGRLKDSSLVATRVADFQMKLCASTSYLERFGHPKSATDLHPNYYFHYSYMNYSGDKSLLVKQLQENRQAQRQRLKANNGEILVSAAIEGEGYVYSPDFIVEQALVEKQLHEILPDPKRTPISLYAVYPHTNFTSAKVRAFIDFLKQQLGASQLPKSI